MSEYTERARKKLKLTSQKKSNKTNYIFENEIENESTNNFPNFNFSSNLKYPLPNLKQTQNLKSGEYNNSFSAMINTEPNNSAIFGMSKIENKEYFSNVYNSALVNNFGIENRSAGNTVINPQYHSNNYNFSNQPGNLLKSNYSKYIPLKNLTPQTKNKINKSFDAIIPRIKKGLFSYPKSNTSISEIYKTPHVEDSQSMFSRNLSDKYRIEKIASNSITNKSIMMADEIDSLVSIRKNDSSSSFNFNKYKIGANYANSDLKNVSSKDKFHTFANNEIIISDDKSPTIIPFKRSESIMFRQPHEKESRRMILELIKLNISEHPQNAYSKPQPKDVQKVLKELLIDPSVISVSAKDSNQTRGDLNKENILNGRLSSQINNFNIANNKGLTNSVEIKNNNFEINNNYYSPVNIPTDNTGANFIYNMDEDSPEKIKLICFLLTPRILYMNAVTYNSEVNKVPLVFQLSPSKLCYLYGVEHYLLQWSEVNKSNVIGTIDILKIVSCSVHWSKGNMFEIHTIKEKSSSTINSSSTGDYNKYEIIANSKEESKLYVNALNFVSQLVKCKAYSFKENKKLKR